MGGWVGEINNKDHLSPAEAGRSAELGNIPLVGGRLKKREKIKFKLSLDICCDVLNHDFSRQ